MSESTHDLYHALRPAESGCTHSMADITHCVICERRLDPARDHVDTCGKRCFRALLRLQRAQS